MSRIFRMGGRNESIMNQCNECNDVELEMSYLKMDRHEPSLSVFKNYRTLNEEKSHLVNP